MNPIPSPSPIAEVDYSLRQRVLKLRWMGLETEAQELIRQLDDRDPASRLPWRHRVPSAARVTD